MTQIKRIWCCYMYIILFYENVILLRIGKNVHKPCSESESPGPISKWVAILRVTID